MAINKKVLSIRLLDNLFISRLNIYKVWRQYAFSTRGCALTREQTSFDRFQTDFALFYYSIVLLDLTILSSN